MDEIGRLLAELLEHDALAADRLSAALEQAAVATSDERDDLTRKAFDQLKVDRERSNAMHDHIQAVLRDGRAS